MATIRQPGFAAGELAPSLWGRTDSPRYGLGVRRLSNFFVSKQGTAVSRAGTKFCGLASNQNVDLNASSGVGGFTHQPEGDPNIVVGGAKVRLIPFYWSDTDTSQNYVLEFGAKYVAVRKFGAVIATVTDLPYLPDDLFKIRYAQSLDVIYIACAGYPPAALKRVGDVDWEYAALDFSRQAPADFSQLRVSEESLTAPDMTHPLEKWSWLATEIRRDDRGILHESAGSRGAGFQWGLVWSVGVTYADRDIVKGIDANGVPSNYYQSKQGSNVGNLPSSSPTFWRLVDNWHYGITYQPLDIVVVNSDGVVTYYQATFLTTNNPPGGDSSGAWVVFTFPGYVLTPWPKDQSVVLSADRPIRLWVPAGSGILADPGFVSFRIYRGRDGQFGLIGELTTAAGTIEGATLFTDTGSQPDYAQPPPLGTNPFLVVASDGTRTETPISVCFYEDRLCFGGTQERPATLFTSATGDYLNFDQRLSPIDSESLIFGLSARRHELIRSVLGKDKLFSLTTSSMWVVGGSQGAPLTPSSVDARVQVDIGTDWPAPIIVGNMLLWVRDKGTGVRGVEFDLSRSTYTAADLSFFAEHLFLGHQIVDWAYCEDPWGVVWAAREDGLLMSMTYGPDDKLFAWARHGVALDNDGKPAVIQSVCSIPEGNEDVLYLALDNPTAGQPAWILRMESRVEVEESLDISDGSLEMPLGDPLGGDSDTATTLPVCLDAFVEFDDVTSNAQGGGTLSGLTHLIGRSVYVNADGAIFGPFTVTNSGTVSLTISDHQVEISRMAVGLGYLCEMETLDLAEGRTRQKVVNNVGLEVKAVGEFWVGETFDAGSLHPRPAPDSIDDMTRTPVSGSWNFGGRIAVRQVLPQPITLRAVTREVERGQG